MRDALSIMDKIASFSGNKISYTSAIEHLNLLDYDYYFRLVELLLAQDLSGVMLLFDEINNKGFEGDLFMNGLSEHFRNLMMCTDPKVTGLLDLPSNTRSRYEVQAHQVKLSYMINALSVLNTAELNYKQARNKRLHTELALIKLTHLHQAIQLLSDEQEALVKKKS